MVDDGDFIIANLMEVLYSEAICMHAFKQVKWHFGCSLYYSQSKLNRRPMRMPSIDEKWFAYAANVDF